MCVCVFFLYRGTVFVSVSFGLLHRLENVSGRVALGYARHFLHRQIGAHVLRALVLNICSHRSRVWVCI